jgi:NADH:ubiquinone oxidoreductase subunit E
MFQTTSGQKIRLEPFRCFGQCARAPNIRMNGVIQGAMTEKRFELLLGVLGRTKP